MNTVVVEKFNGRAQEFHSRELPVDRYVHVWWFEPVRDALVLGSTQDEGLVNLDECRRNGVDLVRRRSGGGLVLLGKDSTMWLDVIISVDHPLWDRDVTSSSFWLGETWMDALTMCGLGHFVQHRSRLVRSPESDLVCFAGRGPGEVFLAGESERPIGTKVVGISQRRTRDHARFQTVVSLRWEPERLLDLLYEPKPDVAALWDSGSNLEVDRDRLMSVMTSCLVRVLS